MTFYAMSKKKTEANDGPAVYCRCTEMRSVATLVEHPRNPNVHPESQLKLLAEVIRGNGWRQPVTVSDLSGYIIKGHGRYQAAKLAGFAEVPVEVQHYENEAAEMADMLADNRIAELSNMDTAQLIDNLGTLPEDTLGLAGFTQEEFEKLLGEAAPEDGVGDTEGITAESQYGVIVMCDSEAEQEKTYNALTAQMYKCKVVNV